MKRRSLDTLFVENRRIRFQFRLHRPLVRMRSITLSATVVIVISLLGIVASQFTPAVPASFTAKVKLTYNRQGDSVTGITYSDANEWKLRSDWTIDKLNVTEDYDTGVYYAYSKILGETLCSANEWPWTPSLFWWNGLLLPNGYDSQYGCHLFSFLIPFVFETSTCFRDPQTPVYQLFKNPIEGPYFFREFLTFNPGYPGKEVFELPNECKTIEPGPCCGDSSNEIFQKIQESNITPEKFASIVKDGWKEK